MSAANTANRNNGIKSLSLYHYTACPFCAITRQAIAANNYPVELRNIQKQTQHRKDLLKGGGKQQVPCLRIQKDDGSETWMYESSDIISYLKRTHAA